MNRYKKYDWEKQLEEIHPRMTMNLLGKEEGRIRPLTLQRTEKTTE